MNANADRLARWVVLGMASGEPMRIDLTLCVLNEIFRLDPEAANSLVHTRVPCNEAIENHPTIICGDGKVGLLGVINGIMAKEDPCGSGVCAVLDAETKKVIGFDLFKFNIPNDLERWM